jgi:aspartyl-tRNA(Asn)/glutamyl-tRNA(Gln) amidotransferase subunit C
MNMNQDEIKQLAQLARLNIPQSEMESVSKDIAAILGFIDTIQAIELDSQVIDSHNKQNIFRTDTVQPLAAAYDLIEAAPSHQDHYVKVPKVLE